MVASCLISLLKKESVLSYSRRCWDRLSLHASLFSFWHASGICWLLVRNKCFHVIEVHFCLPWEVSCALILLDIRVASIVFHCHVLSSRKYLHSHWAACRCWQKCRCGENRSSCRDGAWVTILWLWLPPEKRHHVLPVLSRSYRWATAGFFSMNTSGWRNGHPTTLGWQSSRVT